MQKYQNLLWQIESECEKWNLEKRFDFDLEKLVLQSDLYDEKLESKNLTGFWIEENCGNNAFVFEKGNKLYVPPLKFSGENSIHSVGTILELSLRNGDKIVFRDFDENGNLIESTGLENFILTQGKKTGLPIYFVDNHNWVFYCWAEWKLMTNYKLRITNCQNELPFLIHIDAHKDEGKSVLNKNFVQSDLLSIKQQTTKLKVSNYIFAGIQAGLIQSNFISITESKDVFNYKKKFNLLKKPSQKIILNLDLDFFDSQVSLISLQEKIELIGYFAEKVDLITFATSPGFVNQDLAIAVAEVFLKYL